MGIGRHDATAIVPKPKKRARPSRNCKSRIQIVGNGRKT